MARRREINVFSLSFLDVMSCGFGATLLVFLILHHSDDVATQKVNQDLMAESELLEKDVLEGRQNLVELRNTIAAVTEDTVVAQGRARELIEQIRKLREELASDSKDSTARVAHLNQLRADIRQLEEQNQRLRAAGELKAGNDARRIAGDGDRQYLTGLKLGGKRILILVDRSASMLDNSLVNVLRLRNMPQATQARAPKWRNAQDIVEWITSRMPASSEFQIYSFNTTAKSVAAESGGKWLAVSDRAQLDKAVAAVRALTPEGGTSLVNAFAAAAAMSPPPDNIFLVTDGLPTQGAAPAGDKATGRDRQKYFNQALDRLPAGIPVNTILMPMEGDPMAASAFWQLARATRGAFLAPSRDWP